MNIGKKFEQIFKQDWEETVQNSFIYRLKDTQSGYKGVGNVSDFICYKLPNLFLVECKTHKGKYFPFSAFRQYEVMKKYVDMPGIKAGVVLWMRDYDMVIWVPIQVFIELENRGAKSLSIDEINKRSDIIRVDYIKKRTYVHSNFSKII